LNKIASVDYSELLPHALLHPDRTPQNCWLAGRRWQISQFVTAARSRGCVSVYQRQSDCSSRC
jgi:hypothetical protein